MDWLLQLKEGEEATAASVSAPLARLGLSSTGTSRSASPALSASAASADTEVAPAAAVGESLLITCAQEMLSGDGII